MDNLNFEDERIDFTPIIIYIEYINLQYNHYLKENFQEITYGDSTYLMNIFYHENISQRELADLLFVSESNVAQIIKRLEKKGFITREIDKDNKSKKNLILTKKGKFAVFSLLKKIYEGESKFIEKYSEEDVKKFKQMLYDYSNLSIQGWYSIIFNIIFI